MIRVMRSAAEQVYYIVALIGVANGLLLSVLLFLKKTGNQQMNRSLSVLFLAISMLLMPHLLMARYGIMPTYTFIPFVYCIYLVALASLGPAFFLYIRALSQADSQDKRNYHSVHFIYPVLILIVYFIFYSNHDPIWNPVHLTTLGQFALYLALSVKHYSNLLNVRHATQRRLSRADLTWITVIFGSIVLVFLIHLNSQLEIIIGRFHPFQAALLTAVLYFIMISEFIYRRTDNLHDGQIRYSRSKLEPSEVEEYLNRIHLYLVDTGNFKDPSLKLPQLSRDLKISVNLISRVINEHRGMNFSDYVNSYRIGEAIRLLQDDRMQHITIAAIAYDCGFSSISTFNSAFRKFAKMSPSQFRKQTKTS